jgi:hypothetical protein
MSYVDFKVLEDSSSRTSNATEKMFIDQLNQIMGIEN